MNPILHNTGFGSSAPANCATRHVEVKKMVRPRLSKTLLATLFFAFTAHTSVQAAPLALPDVPLPVANFMNPNVMLLLDNSGSMNNIIWASGYNANTTYPDWSDSGNLWSATSGNVGLSSLTSCTTTGYYEGNDGTTTKCLKLPDPVGGGDTRYAGNYLNYLFSTYADNTDLTGGTIPNDYRMNVLRTVSTNLVNGTPDMRFGVTSFYTDDGGKIDVGCADNNSSSVATAIGGLTASTWTPLAETYYEVTRYFRGLGSRFTTGVTHTSPIVYRCQKNFALIVTDGYPTYDNDIPSNGTGEPVASTCVSSDVRNCDGLAPATVSGDYPNFPQYSDGFEVLTKGNDNNAYSSEGATLLLDDIAKFAHDVDLRPTGSDAAGVSFNDPAYEKQNLITYTVGFSTANQMLEDAAAYGDGTYFTASDAVTLTDSLRKAIVDIEGKTGSASAVSSSTGFVSSDTFLYQGRFNSVGWDGQLLGYKIDPFSGDVDVLPQWDAGDPKLMPSAGSREIISYNGTKGVPFAWAAAATADTLTAAQLAFVETQDRLNYLRGDASNEIKNGGTFRDRSNKLGSIVNSAPYYVGPPAFRYPDIWNTFQKAAPENCGADSCKYSKFKENNKNRQPVVYVGANDGMLHGFNGETGEELLAYVPSMVYPNLKAYSETTYSHKYMVDGTPTIIDAFYNNTWHTVLVSGLNNGGQGVFALDVTDPTKFSETNASKLVLWEFNDDGIGAATGTGDADMGFSFSRPAIVRMQNGDWAAVFGNGYNNTVDDTATGGKVSTTGNGAIYVVNLETGKLIKKFDTGQGTAQDPESLGRPNGVATVAPVDFDGDYIADYIYAGDLFGNLWKLDVTDPSPTKWIFANTTGKIFKPLFVAKDAGGKRQPITSRPEVVKSNNVDGSLMVYFGTGKYLELSDNTSVGATTQSVYGVLDEGVAIADRSAFLQQQIVNGADGQLEAFCDESKSNCEDQQVREVSNKGDDKYQSWFLDLPTQGERMVSDLFVRGAPVKNLIFVTRVPSADACAFGGSSWLMEVDARDGSKTRKPVFDLNLDNKINGLDNVGDTTVMNGWKMDGIVTIPTVITDGVKEYKYMSSSTGNINKITENPPVGTYGRQSWRQLK
ncbi:MAG: hypothetical protein JSW10_03775 [Pseudomonadota bacterium]|nr:MAG: hypothetical protein JSW10_03775 [Pseudomonadota bacterium]